MHSKQKKQAVFFL